MKLRSLVALLAVFAVLTGLAVSAGAAAPAAGRDLYVVLLSGRPLAGYGGGVAGLAPTSPEVTGASRLDAGSAASRAYLAYLETRQDTFLAQAGAVLGRSVTARFRYGAVLNGLAVALSPNEATAVRAMPGVTRVAKDFERQLLTDAGPAWIGATAIWDGSGTGGLPGTKGEGVVVGVIDTGINHDHPSFADPGPVDGYGYTNPKGAFFGVCDPVTGAPFCNGKLIGAWDFTGTSPEDTNGHGSHTASTSAGNVVDARLFGPTLTVEKRLSGVAPHANLITYKACVETCPITALLAGINQATLDGVDVINYSIGGTSADPWSDLDALAFRDARNAGIFVSASAGNDGPGPATIGSPADAPWVMTVAASTHNRTFLNSLVGLSGGSSPLGDIHGKSVTSGYGPAPVVYAGDYGYPLCGDGEALPTGEAVVNPFPPGTFHGEIVVCDRGIYGRVEKSQNVMEGGAGGYVLANDEPSGDSLIADPYYLPGVNIGYSDGQALEAWLAGGTGHTATITGTSLDTTPATGDVMASFSSRGPNPATGDILKPDVTAPGVDIFAAFNTVDPTAPPEYNVISGTSMSSPHNTGAAALLRAVHPDWSPDEVRSAMVTTAFTSMPGSGSETHVPLKEDGATAADPFDVGGGRVDLRRAGAAGLVLDESVSDYTAADPGAGGDPSSLNLPTLASGACDGTCSWTRIVTSTAGSPVTWTASALAADGMSVTIEPSSFTLAPGATQELTVTADVSAAGAGGWKFGRVVLTPDAASVPQAHLTLAANKVGGAGSLERTTLHFHGNLGEGDCTGDGKTDLIACSGPTLVQSDVLSDSPAASWKGGPAEWALTGAGDRTIYDPSWIWCLRTDDPANADESQCPETETPAPGPTTLEGPMTVEWWAQCALTCAAVPTSWTVRLWADGVQVLETQVEAGLAPTNAPTLLDATVDVPRVTASHRLTLQLEPVYLADQAVQFAVYYDSTQPCLPTAASAPCDSRVELPVVRPDLVVESATATPNPASKGDVVQLDAVVRNDSTLPAPASQTEFSDGDTVVGTAATPALDAGESTTVSVEWDTADAAVGEHSLTVTANAEQAFREASSSNNTAELTVTVRQLSHRLVVRDAKASPNKAKEGEKVLLTAVIANEGNGAAPATTTEFRLDGGAVIGAVATPAIEPGATTIVTQGWNTKKLIGEYRILITADAAGARPDTGTLTVTVKGNKVKNGSFEESANGDTPDGWTSSGTTSYDGESASAGPGGSWTSEPVGVQAGSSYDLTAVATGSPGTILVQQLSAAGLLVGSVSLPAVGSLANVLTVVPAATQIRLVLKGGPTGTTFDGVGLYDR